MEVGVWGLGFGDHHVDACLFSFVKMWFMSFLMFRVHGSGFRVWGLGIQGLRFRVQGLGLGLRGWGKGLRCTVWCLGFRV